MSRRKAEHDELARLEREHVLRVAQLPPHDTTGPSNAERRMLERDRAEQPAVAYVW
jgi:hypothetical protein